MAQRELVAKKTLQFIIREFSELQGLLLLIESVEKNETSESVELLVKEIKKILRKLRGGIFGSEERVVYRLSSQYEHLKVAFRFSAGELEPNERDLISRLLEEGDVFNKQLVKIGSRGGELEQALYKAKDSPTTKDISRVKLLLQEGITNDEAFEAIVKKIITSFKEIKILKSQLLPAITYPDLALIIIKAKGWDFPNAMVLYNKAKWDEIQQLVDLQQFLRYGYNKERFKNSEYNTLSKEEKHAKALEIQQLFPSDERRNDDERSGYGRYLLYDRPHGMGYPRYNDYLPWGWNYTVEKVIVGYVEFKSIERQADYFLGAKMIYRIAAQKGYGPYLFELAFAYAATQHRPVVIDRLECSPAARKVWQFFDTRRYIIKYPAALNKYPELIGYTKEEVYRKFGSGAFASVFGRDGYPEGTPGQKRLELGEKASYKIIGTKGYVPSYLQTEGEKDENTIFGTLAALDKAYYYDGRVTELESLIRRGEIKKRHREELFQCGHAFFQSSKSSGGY